MCTFVPCVHAYTYIVVRIYKGVHRCIYKHTHINRAYTTHTYMHTYTHTYIPLAALCMSLQSRNIIHTYTHIYMHTYLWQHSARPYDPEIALHEGSVHHTYICTYIHVYIPLAALCASIRSRNSSS